MAESASRAIKPAFDVVDLDRNTVAVPFEKLRMFTVRDLKVCGNFTPSVQGLSLGLLLTLLTNRLPQDGASACVLV